MFHQTSLLLKTAPMIPFFSQRDGTMPEPHSLRLSYHIAILSGFPSISDPPESTFEALSHLALKLWSDILSLYEEWRRHDGAYLFILLCIDISLSPDSIDLSSTKHIDDLSSIPHLEITSGTYRRVSAFFFLFFVFFYNPLCLIVDVQRCVITSNWRWWKGWVVDGDENDSR